MKVRKPVKAGKLSSWLQLAVVAGMIFPFGTVGCRSTASSGSTDGCGGGCTGR